MLYPAELRGLVLFLLSNRQFRCTAVGFEHRNSRNPDFEASPDCRGDVIFVSAPIILESGSDVSVGRQLLHYFRSVQVCAEAIRRSLRIISPGQLISGRRPPALLVSTRTTFLALGDKGTSPTL